MMPLKLNAKTCLSAVLLAAILSCLTASTQASEDESQKVIAILNAYDSREYEKAKALCEKLLAAHPKSLTGHYLLGNALVKLYQLNEAEAAYKYCLRGGKGSSEANYAYKALEQIYDQRRNANAPANLGSGTVAIQQQSESARDSIRDEEMRNRLEQEAKDKIAVKQRVLDDKVAQVERDMQFNLANSPRGRFARFYRQDYQDQVKADAKAQIERLKKDFAREQDEINEACRKRLADLDDYKHNIESRRAAR